MEEPGLGSKFSWIFFALNAKPTSMRRAIAERLATKESVVIVDQPVSVLRGREVPGFKQRRVPLTSTETSWHYRPLHFPEQLPGIGKAARLLNRRLLERELDRLVPPSQPRVVCYDSPSQYYLAKELHDDISVYVAIDDRTLRVTGVPIKGEIEAEKKLLQRVDKIVCVSETLAETLSSRIPSSHTKPVHVLSNGYDERMFDPQQNYSEPEILKRIPRPRVLVAGHVSNRIDWEGIRRASVLRPQWTWVFLGPTDPGMEEIISHDLREHRFWHPQVPLVNVPAWIRHCDACAVPYRLNAFTRASSPLKAIEYLAMGAFLLSTRVPALEQYKDVTSWVEEGNGATYASALDKAISQASDPLHVAASILAVRNDSWEKKAEQFKEIVFGIQPSLTSASQARAVISCN